MARLAWTIRFEFTRALRDGTTLVYLGFPLIAYPMLMWGMLQALRLGDQQAEQELLRVAVHASAGELDLGGPPIERVDGDLADLDAGRLDAWIEGPPERLRIVHRSGSARSVRAVDRIEARLDRSAERRLAEHVDALGGDRGALAPTVVRVEGTDTSGEMILFVLGLTAAVLAPVGLVISGFSPAAELFVSDRERGALESLLCAPVSRAEVVVARVVTLAAISAGAAFSSLVALGLTLTHALAFSDDGTAGALPGVGGVIAVGVLLASGSLVTSSVFAVAFSLVRTFREAQSLASPLMLVMLAPAGVAMVARLGGDTAHLWWIPLFHTGAQISEAVAGQLGWTLLGGVAVDLATAGLILGAWGRWLGFDALIAGVGRPAWLSRMLGDQA